MTETVTLYHGTSEGHLANLLAHGFIRPAISAADFTRELISAFLPEDKITPELVEKVSWHGRARSRAEESNSGRTLFATGSRKVAEEFGLLSRNGGELYQEVYNALKYLGHEVAPRFDNARPVLLELEVPVKDINEAYRKSITRGADGKPSGAGGYQVFIDDTTNVRIKSVTFGGQQRGKWMFFGGESGDWTFDNQKPVAPEEAKGKIKSEYATPSARKPPSEKQALLDEIYAFARDPQSVMIMARVGMLEYPVAETVVEGADGKPKVVRVPDMEFEPRGKQLESMGFAVSQKYALPCDLTPREVKALLDIVDIRQQRGELSAEGAIEKLGLLLDRLETRNPDIGAIDFDRKDPRKLMQALTLAVHGANRDDIAHSLNAKETPEYLTQKDQAMRMTGMSGSNLPWNPAPKTLQAICDEMDRKLSKFDSQFARTPNVEKPVPAVSAPADAKPAP